MTSTFGQLPHHLHRKKHRHHHKKGKTLNELMEESFSHPIPTTDPRIQLFDGEYQLTEEGWGFFRAQVNEALAPLKNTVLTFNFGKKS
jgi:fatty acid desaturase